MSEAKYVASRDGEVFNHNLINFNALRHYGGHSDLEHVQQYLEHFVTSEATQEQKVLELLKQAYQFIDNSKYWKCIVNLAHFILESQRETISCNEAMSILDRSLTAFQQKRWNKIVSFSGR